MLGHFAESLHAQRYRIEPVDEMSFIARRKAPLWTWFGGIDAELLALGPLQSAVLDVNGLAPDAASRGGARLRCPDGYQQIGAARRVASQIGRAVTDLVRRGVPDVIVSGWFSDPAWERPVSDA